MDIDWTPQQTPYIPELEESVRLMIRGRDGLLRAAYSVADEAWDAPAYTEDKWTYREMLAHVATNDLRPQARLRGVMGKWDDDEQQRILKTAEWNEEQVAPLRGKSVRELVDLMQKNRHDTAVLISQLSAGDLQKTVKFADGREFTIRDYVAFLGEHDSVHAGQFVAASRARWSS
jgi:ribosomal protein L29